MWEQILGRVRWMGSQGNVRDGLSVKKKERRERPSPARVSPPYLFSSALSLLASPPRHPSSRAHEPPPFAVFVRRRQGQDPSDACSKLTCRCCCCCLVIDLCC